MKTTTLIVIHDLKLRTRRHFTHWLQVIFCMPGCSTTKLTGWFYVSFASCFCRFLTTKEKFHGFVDSEWQGPKGEKASENDKVEETSVEEPDAKKLKLDPEERNKAGKPDGKRHRGQNKSRPHIKPTTYDEKRLCLSVIQV